jgi:abequosyltransferase
MENQFFISICIPSYNRPSGLHRLLKSIDTTRHINDLQIVICEDNAPKRLEVRAVVDEYKKNSPYHVKYVENPVNFGHGKNWRQCSSQSDGEYLIYMGDDDMFISASLDNFIDWLLSHRNLGYVLRAYRSITNGKIEYFKYYNKDKFYEAGIDGYTAFFMKSNLMSGYTIKRDYTKEFTTDSLDFTLYFQMYLMAEVCLKYSSGYCNIPIAQYIGDGVSYFGVNQVEKDYYKPGENAANDLANINKFFVLTEYIDNKHKINSTIVIKNEFSKYSSYSTMLKYRKMGIKQLFACRKYLISVGLNTSIYFNLYFVGLLFFGAYFCNRLVNIIKKINGGRPEL